MKYEAHIKSEENSSRNFQRRYGIVHCTKKTVRMINNLKKTILYCSEDVLCAGSERCPISDLNIHPVDSLHAFPLVFYSHIQLRQAVEIEAL